MTAAASGPTPAEAPSPYLHHPWIDALVGYGGLYLLTAPLVIALASSTGLLEWPIWFATIAALLISVPHYGATYLRVYEKRSERRRYAVFAIYLTGALFAAFVASLYSARLGSIFLTIYIYWSPWHFAGQNFGVAMTSLRRRRVHIDPLARRLLYASFALGFGLSTLALSRLGSSFQGNVVGTGDGSVYEFYRLGVPTDVATVLIQILAPIYTAATIGAIVRLASVATFRDLVPTISVLLTHGLWYALPALLTEQIPLLYAGVWVSALHAAQYLWITSYYAKKSDGAPSSRFFGKCLLIGSAIAVVPPLAFSPGLLGPVAPLSAHAAIVFFALMNIHHFILDGAVWKLRDGRVARALLHDGTFDEEKEVPKQRWLRPTLYAVGLAALLLPVWVSVEVMRAASSTDHAVVESAAKRLAFFGRDNPDVSFVLGQHRAIADDRAGAITAYRRTLEMSPGHPGASYRLAGLLLANPDDRPEALELARAAVNTTGYADPAALIVLGRANLATGNVPSARLALENAVRIATQTGDQELARIATRLLRSTSSGSPDRGWRR